MGMPLPSTNIIKRALTGFVVGLIGLLSFLAGGWVLLAVILLVTVFGSLEYVKILNCKGFYPFKTTIIMASLGFSILASILSELKGFVIKSSAPN